MDRLFDSAIEDKKIVALLQAKKFRKIGEGFSAHVFGATDKSVVIKIFPPLNVGGPEDIKFVNNNPILRHTEALTARWQKFRIIKWLRQKAKLIIAVSRNAGEDKRSDHRDDIHIKGYETYIRMGLMHDLPTRIIPNCLTQLSVNIGKTLKNYYEKPEKIVLQQRFSEDLLIINQLNQTARLGETDKCFKLIEDAVNYQLYLWKIGIADTDMSFNIFENLIIFSNGTLHLHDANDLTDSKSVALWFIKEKEKDLSRIFKELSACSIDEFIHRYHYNGIFETAKKLYGILPRQNRDEMVSFFLKLAKEKLTEDQLNTRWNNLKKEDIAHS